MAKGYVVANVSVADVEGYEAYRSRTRAIIESYGGRFLVRGGAIEVREGDPQIDRLVILEFPSVEGARNFYGSPEYQAIVPLRTSTSDASLFIAEGVD
jgi:uncharacterized protein (DUF1330 family)